MKYLNKIASVLFIAALGVMTLTSCEGSELFNVNAPDWLSDMGGEEEEEEVIEVTPNPTELGAADNTTPWWTLFTDDIQAEAGKTYQIKFNNYGGGSNWNNFVFILRNAAKDNEYGVFRADNWCWSTKYPDGADSDNFCAKSMESSDRDWATWLKAMSLAKCTLTLTNYGNGSADIKCTMLGSDGVTYTQEYTNIEVDKDDLYFAFTVDNSHIEFGDINVEDSEPVSMTLSAPKKVLTTMTEEELIASISATVKFENEVTSTVSGKDLEIRTIPDMGTTGTKTLVAVYNKTYLGENSTKPVIATVEFQVVDKMYTTVGSVSNTDPFGAAHSEAVKVESGQTFVSTFTNYTDGSANWNNFVVELFNADKSKYYATVRADNFGWGDGYAACTPSGGQADWAVWLKAMDGAKVTVYVTNNGDGTADVKCVMLGNDGETYKQDYIGINTVDPDNCYFHFTIEKAHLEFDTIVGDEMNTSPFGAEHSEAINVPSGKTYVTSFINYTDGSANWNNFVVELFNADKSKYYATVRADNFGWGDGYAACTPSGGQADWAVWLKAMDGAKVTVYVTNNGDGTADVKCVMLGNDGETYKQDYIGINTIDPDNCYFHFTMEKAHLVFE